MPREVLLVVAIGAVLAVFLPVTVAIARRIKRGGPQPRTLHDPEATLRLEELSRAVDMIAIEVERISESQRYTTRLLSERLPAKELSAGPATPGSPG